MVRLTWDKPGERLFEFGVDHVVLYPNGSAGVPWNGVVSIDEAVAGGETEAYYFDGVKYFDSVANEDFQATLAAFTYPIEFEECIGSFEVSPGIRLGYQPRETFGLSWRTRVGNDIDGVDHGYKLHIVYGVTASSSSKSNQTSAEAPVPLNFEWTINAVPLMPGAELTQIGGPGDWVWPDGFGMVGWPNGPDGNTPVKGWKATSYVMIESDQVDSLALSDLEGRLYGTSYAPAYLPSQFDLINILNGVDVINPGGSPPADPVPGGDPNSPLALTIADYGPLNPIAWDGADQHLYISTSNNTRYYAVKVTPGTGIVATPSYGFTTTETSNMPMIYGSEFVRPGYAVTLIYDDEQAPLTPYRAAVLHVSGSTVEIASAVDSPYPVYNAGLPMLRSCIAAPDSGEVFFYANRWMGSGYTVEVWHSTVSLTGQISDPVLIGPVTYPTLTGGSQALGGCSSDVLMFSDRLALDLPTKAVYDLQNPQVIIDGSLLFPFIEGLSVFQIQMAPRLKPRHMALVYKDAAYPPTVTKLVDVLVAADGSSSSIVGEWDAPAGTRMVNHGYNGLGEVVVVCWETFDGPYTFVRDVFGTPQVITPAVDLSTFTNIDPITPTSNSHHLWLANTYTPDNVAQLRVFS